MKRTNSLYLQVAEALRGEILSGEYSVDSRLPSEFKLSESFKVSRVTLRKALACLADEGLVEKIRGVGTFVRRPKKVRRIFHSSVVESFSKMAVEQGYQVKTNVIKAEEVCVSPVLAEALKTKRALFISRLRLIDGEPVTLENNYFPLPKYQFLAKADLTGSLYELVNKKVGVKKMFFDDTTISVTLATQEQASLLNRSVGFPLFLLRTVVNDEQGNLVHVGIQYTVSDRYEFHI